MAVMKSLPEDKKQMLKDQALQDSMCIKIKAVAGQEVSIKN